MAAAAFAVLTVGMLSFTSCEEFDDSQIQASLDDLNSRVENLENALADLQNDVDAASALLAEGKIIKSIAANEDGTQYTITYVDSEDEADVITVGTGDPVITMIQEGDVWYWAKIGANGEPEHLLGTDNKVPVVTVIPDQVAPKLDVDENGNLLVSIDNGGSWTETGVAISDIYTPVFSGVEIEDGEVTFKLANGDSFTVPMVEDLVCEFLTGKTIFASGETQNLAMNVSGFVKYDLEAPQGWSATFDGTKITVTAPDYESEWFTDPYVTSGYIKLWLYDNKGNVVFDKLSVQAGGTQMVVLGTELDESGKVNVVATTPYAYMDFYIGVMKADEFTAEAAAAIANSPDTEAVACEEDDEYNLVPYSVPFTDFVSDPQVGEPYVIWAIQAQFGESVSPDDVITVIYNYGMNVDVKIDNISFRDATVSVTPGASTRYFYGITLASDFYPESLVNMINYGMYSATSDAVNATITELSSSDQPNVRFDVVPGTTYTIWYVIETDAGSYSVGDVVSQEFTLDPVTEGGSAAVTFNPEEIEVTYNSISVPFTRPENTYQLYATYLSESEFANNYSSDEAAVKEMLLASYPFNMDYPATADVYGNATMKPNTKGYVFVVVIDNDGMVGPLVKQEVSTTDVPRDANIGVALAGDVVAASTSASVELDVTGTPTYVVYYLADRQSFDTHWTYKGDVELVKSEMALSPTNYNWTRVDYSTLSDGVLELENLDFKTEYIIIGSVASKNPTDVNPDNLMLSADYFVAEFTTPAPTIILKDDPGYADMVPELSEVNYTESWGSIYANFDITPSADAVMCYYYAVSAPLEGDVEDLVTEIAGKGTGMAVATMPTISFSRYMYQPLTVYISWTDAEGNFYEPVIVDVPMPAE